MFCCITVTNRGKAALKPPLCTCPSKGPEHASPTSEPTRPKANPPPSQSAPFTWKLTFRKTKNSKTETSPGQTGTNPRAERGRSPGPVPTTPACRSKLVPSTALSGRTAPSRAKPSTDTAGREERVSLRVRPLGQGTRGGKRPRCHGRRADEGEHGGSFGLLAFHFPGHKNTELSHENPVLSAQPYHQQHNCQREVIFTFLAAGSHKKRFPSCPAMFTASWRSERLRGAAGPVLVWHHLCHERPQPPQEPQNYQITEGFGLERTMKTILERPKPS